MSSGKPSTGASHPASAHSGSQVSDTHSTSSGARPTNFVIIVSRYCAHGALLYVTLIPYFDSNALRWLFTWSTAADQVKKLTLSAACAALPHGRPAAPVSPAAPAILRKLRRSIIRRLENALIAVAS